MLITIVSMRYSSGMVSSTTVRALVLGRFSPKKLKIELKDNAKKWIKIFHIIRGWCFSNLGRRCLLSGCKTAVGPLNTFLQTSGLDLALYVAEADIAEAKLQTLRDSRSNNIIRDATVTAETLEIAPQFQEKRLRKKKPLFDDEGALRL